MVDKNLFFYDLAVVAIMKNEEPYVKEWIEYHLLAGVDHFYIYDNDSTPEFKKILQPYIDAGIVTYTFFPGKARHYEAYNDAIKRFKFECRYMAFIDGDEFIFPKSKPTIIEIVDEILKNNSNAGGLVANWQTFGSNYQEKADYTRGVLERFTRRAPKNWGTPADEYSLPGGNSYVKTIANPRRLKYSDDAHHAKYMVGFYSVNSNGQFSVFNNQFPTISYPILTEKIVVNHYSVKSREEYERRATSGTSTRIEKSPRLKPINHNSNNDEFDDGILRYRDSRRGVLFTGGGIENLFQRKQINYAQLLNTLSYNLFPVVVKNTPLQFFVGKMENFLTCLHLISNLKGKILDETGSRFFEEISLNSIQKTLYTGLAVSDLMLLIGEMPKILNLPYTAVKNIRESLLQIIPQLLVSFRVNALWQEFVELDYKLDMLKNFKP